MNTELIRKGVAEFVGTFTLVFAGCGALMVSERFPGTVAPGSVAVIFGLVVASVIYAVGHISGAHINPAVTIAFTLTRHFPKREVPIYLAGQFLGAIFAMGILTLLLPEGLQYGATVPHVSSLQAFGWEVVMTFILMFVIMAVATDTRALGTMAGAAVGAAVAVDAFVGGPVTGASMNPARSLAPALASGNFEGLWIYLVAPTVGAVLAAWLYVWIRCENCKSTA